MFFKKKNRTDKDIENQPLFYIEYLGKPLRKEDEIKELIIKELNNLKSDKAGYSNTISIDHAIDIVKNV